MYRLFYLYHICEREREPLELQHTFLLCTSSNNITYTYLPEMTTANPVLRYGTRLRAVSYFSLQSYCTRAAKPRAARNEGVSPRISIVIVTSWFAIALDEIRTRRILREKTDCKQSSTGQTILNLSGHLAN